MKPTDLDSNILIGETGTRASGEVPVSPSLTPAAPAAPRPRLIAVSRPFTRAWTQMTLPEIKTFAACLSAVSWKNPFPERICLQKNALSSILGISPSGGHQPEMLRAALGQMPSHSFVDFSSWDRHLYSAGQLITGIEEAPDTLTFCFNRDFLPLFGNLSRDYVTFLNTDIYGMSSRQAFYLYKELRTNSDSRTLNRKCFSGHDLRLILRVPLSAPDTASSPARVTGSAQQQLNIAPQSDAVPVTPSVTTVFDCSSFEKSVLLPALEDLSSCRMVNLSRDSSGRLCLKEKKDSCVTGYTLTWSVNLYPLTPVRETGSLAVGEVPVSPSVSLSQPLSSSLDASTYIPCTRNSFNSFPQHQYSSDDFARIELLKRGKLH